MRRTSTGPRTTTARSRMKPSASRGRASSKDKVQFWLTNQNKYRPIYGVNASITPDAAGSQRTKYAMPMTLKWTRAQTNKLLFEGGAALSKGRFDNGYQSSVTTSYDRETIQNTKIYAITDQANSKSFGASTGGYSAVIWDQRVGRFATHLRHRLACVEGRHRSRQRRNAATELVHRRPDDDVQCRRAAVGHAAHSPRVHRRVLSGARALRAGPLDVQARHGHRRTALRLLPRHRRRRHAAVEPLEPGAVLPGIRAAALEGPVASGRHRLRRLRQRPDRDQGERRPLRRAARHRDAARQQSADDDRRAPTRAPGET